MAVAPSARARRAFGLSGAPVLLRGGAGTSWRVGTHVMKPLDVSVEQLAWHRTTLAPAIPSALRVAIPSRARDGRLVADGWTARSFLEGEHEDRRWVDIVAVGRRLHEAVRRLARPGFLGQRGDNWAVADQLAWGEGDPAPYLATTHLPRLLPLMRPVNATSQVVHGDLAGNVLFHPELPPAVIDLSVYWRPPAYASGVVVVDALLWEGADESLIRSVSDEPCFGQCLLRALAFRLITDAMFNADRDAPNPAYDRVVGIVIESLSDLA